MEQEQLKIFLNKNLKKSCSVTFRTSLTTKEIISQAASLLNIKLKKGFILFDSSGNEMDDDDIELHNPSEPLFLSQGEAFQKECCLSIYEELKLLGQGGFGLVKLYKNKLTDELFALKFVDYSSLLNTEDVGRMYNEIALLRGLRHTNIVKLVDAFDLKDKMCFVMEYCSGGELMDYIGSKAPLPEPEVINLTMQIVDAVRYCHNSKVIHRDLKPENVLFADELRNLIKIVDFGISGMFNGGKQGDVSEAGSLLYTAPEVLSRNDLRASPALDVWSIGCIIYLMLTNTHPFLCKTQDECIAKILSGKFPPLPRSVSTYWKSFFSKIFKTNPEERWTILEISTYFDHLRFGYSSSSSSSPSPTLIVTAREEEKKQAKVDIPIRSQNRNQTIIKPSMPLKSNRESAIKKYKSQAVIKSKEPPKASKTITKGKK